MIQRIQTIFLFIAVLCAVALFYTGQDVVLFNLPVATIFSIIIILLGGLSIFSYKTRNRQILFNNLNIFINALLIGLLVYWLLKISGGINFPEKGIEPFFPSLAIIMLAFANIYIRRDERLVKSVDRIR